MGTCWRVSVVGAPGLDLAPLHACIQAELDLVVAQMSHWECESDISRHARAEAGSWQALPQPFLEVLRCALEIAEASNGAFDPTVGPLVDAWGFGPAAAGDPPSRLPDGATLASARARTGWRHVALREDPPALLQPGGIALDLSGIAKGHGVDAVAAALRQRGIAAALVDVGGELAGFGRKPDGKPWQVLVEAVPEGGRDDDAMPCILALDGVAVATSGLHWHQFEHDGRHYSHTLDPRTGAPVEHAPVAVTVVATRAMHADAWATALTVMGVDAGFDFAEANGIAARFVPDAGTGCAVRATSTFPQPVAA
ncbi:MAG: FAD:protein FMN transferase [Pseudomonadota bacterium]|nr:FAD:protein FMN transferase [Pseudomonadota bacterium]